MKYMGSKNRIAKHILPIILKDRREGQWYVEPFVGGANMIDKVDGKRLGADNNKYLIKALCFIRDEPNLIPNNNLEYTKEMFDIAKIGSLSNPIDCFAMFQYTFGSIFKGSWAKNKRGTDYVKEVVKNILKQSENIQGVYFKHLSYLNLTLNESCIIYCDPPYEGTTGYKTGTFNHTEFWEWCRIKTKQGHKVFISEYSAPDDFKCIWEKDVRVTVGRNNALKHTEKLFIYKG